MERPERTSPRSMSVMGVWDARACPLTLGSMLIFAAEVQAQKTLRECGSSTVCLVRHGASAGPGDSASVALRAMSLRGGAADPDTGLFSALDGVDGIEGCYEASSLDAIRQAMETAGASWTAWPSPDEADARGYLAHAHDSLARIGEFFRTHGRSPSLTMKPGLMQWAGDFLAEQAGSSLRVAVHLKNDPRVRGCSNAKVDVWLDFLEECARDEDAVFILVGRDAVDARILRLRNVLPLRPRATTLPQELAVIRSCGGFLGMASGPCNMAILSPLPYVIFKNPDHHAAAMDRELGGADHFPFASACQKIFREVETRARLAEAFAALRAHLRSGAAAGGP